MKIGTRFITKKSLTHEMFCEKIKNLYGDEYTVLGQYINTSTKILVKHNILNCGYEWETFPLNILKGHTCIKCCGQKISQKMSKTHEQFIKEVFDLVNNEYIVLSKYKNAKTKVLIRHNNGVCNYEYYVTPDCFLRGRRCPKCFARNILDNTQSYKEKIYKLVKDEYSLIGEYINSDIKIKLIHNKCGNIYKVDSTSFLGGRRCPLCFGKIKKTTKRFKEEIYNLVGNEYKVLGKYINSQAKILMKHLICGNDFLITPSDFLQGRRCVCNNKSRGEIKIENYLKKNKIHFETQYKIKDCKNVFPLPFDFAILNIKNEIIFLIEYQGQQHFKPVNFGGISEERALNNFQKTQFNDKIKKEYCFNNNILLLCISYRDSKNINDIIKKQIEYFKLGGGENVY